MASEVEIINDALGELGEPAITSRTEDTPQGNAANRFFDRARQELLEEHNWRFATKYETLAKLAADPNQKYENAFQAPNNFIRVVEFNEVDPDNVVEPLFEMVGDKFYTDDSTAKLAFVYDADVSTFSPGAARALAFKMASKMARLLTDSTTQKEEMLKEYKSALRSAKATDSMHQRQPLPNKAAYSGFIQARVGGKGYKNPEVTATPY